MDNNNKRDPGFGFKFKHINLFIYFSETTLVGGRVIFLKKKTTCTGLVKCCAIIKSCWCRDLEKKSDQNFIWLDGWMDDQLEETVKHAPFWVINSQYKI